MLFKIRYFPKWAAEIAAALIALILFTPQAKAFFEKNQWQSVYIFGLALTLSYLLTPVFGWIARKGGILDIPDERKPHLDSTPLLGGGSVFLGTIIASYWLGGMFYSRGLLSILIGSAILFGAGLADDIKGLSAGFRLCIQMIAGAIVISSGVILSVIPENLGIISDIGNILLTFTWIIGITNGMNFFDGMDGLAAGLGAVIGFFLSVVAFRAGQPHAGWVCIGVSGACIGFLPHNFPIRERADIFLGDAGSTFIGFILASLAVYGDWAENDPVVALISPMLIFWLLIFDMIHITVDRIGSGKVKTFREWIEYVGKDHLHHRLSNVLGGARQSVLFIYMLSFCMGTSAIVLHGAGALEAILLLLQAAFILILVTILERRGRSLNRICNRSSS